MSLLESLARHLASHGLGTFLPDGSVEAGDWSLFLEALPPQPDRCIALYQYGGQESDGGNPWDDVRVQVHVSGTEDPRVSRTRAEAIFSELHGLSSVSLYGGLWLTDCIGVFGGAVHIGTDTNGRHRHTVTLAVSYDNPTVHRPAL